jgi:hypothetical protein
VVNHTKYYKWEGGHFPKIGPWWILWIRVCLWVVCVSKVIQLCSNQLVVWFVQIHVNSWPTCHLSYSLSQNSNTPFLPPKCCELKNIPQLFFSLFSPLDSHLSLSRNLGVCQCLSIFLWNVKCMHVGSISWRWNVVNVHKFNMGYKISITFNTMHT